MAINDFFFLAILHNLLIFCINLPFFWRSYIIFHFFYQFTNIFGDSTLFFIYRINLSKFLVILYFLGQFTNCFGDFTLLSTSSIIFATLSNKFCVGLTSCMAIYHLFFWRFYIIFHFLYLITKFF